MRSALQFGGVYANLSVAVLGVVVFAAAGVARRAAAGS
jgi:hypothetical protein